MALSLTVNLMTPRKPFVSSLALLKMLKHGRAGVPMEVMGESLTRASLFFHFDVFAQECSSEISLTSTPSKLSTSSRCRRVALL